MRDLAVDLGYRSLGLLFKLVAWHLSRSREAWESALNQPAPVLRFFYLVGGLVIASYLVPGAFRELGVAGGISYAVALSGAVSNATFDSLVKTRFEEVPAILHI